MDNKNHNLPVRKHPAHPAPVERFNEPTIIQVNVCTLSRKPLLANQHVHDVLRSVWMEATAWRVGDYVMMPDHVHLFCAPGQVPRFNLKRWVAYWKREASCRLASGENNLWQKDCWDTQMRTLEQYNEKLAYVRQNPARKGLVDEARDWPYQGRIFEIRW